MSLNAKSTIESGKAILGIEFGSTRIKAVLIDEENKPIAQGSHTWENQLENGLWTYSIDAIWNGVQDCYADLRTNVNKEYGIEIENLAAIGVSAMMHGYMAFNDKEEILVPFRTWRNTNTGKAAAELSELFVYNIPLRWSISHLYQAILNKEEHVKDITFLTTLAGYVHWQITGEKVLGIGDASGMLPINPETKNYSAEMVKKFNDLVAPYGYSWTLEDILPKVLLAGENAGCLTEKGAKLLDVSGHLKAGVPVCPPEGDAGTGMVATNAVKQRTGNVSAGTSSFSMIVLEKDLSKPYEMIDMVTTPDGSLVAMVHCNNCTSDLNAWVNIFKEYQELMGMPVDMDEIFGKLYNNSAATVLGQEGDWLHISSGSVDGYVKAQYVVVGNDELVRSVARRVATVATQTLYVRSEATTESSVLGMVPGDDDLTVVDESTAAQGWVKVSIEEGEGYVSTQYVTLSTEFKYAESKAEEEARLAREAAEREAAAAAARKSSKSSSSSSSSSKSYSAPSGSNGSAVANYAVQFVGNPYVYGGTSLTNGADCSGFVMSVYRQFGVSLPHSSSALRSSGYGVSQGKMQPGDIVCYSGHVGIYIGNGQIVHASNARDGIKISTAYYRSILAVRRIF